MNYKNEFPPSRKRKSGWLCALVVGLCSNLSLHADDADIQPPAGDGNNEVSFSRLLPKDYVSDFPGERVNVQSLSLTHRYQDIVIPGNRGMDIVVERATSSAFTLVGFGDVNFGLVLPSIGTRYGSSGNSENYGCLGNLKGFRATSEFGHQLGPIGYPDTSYAPADTIAAFNDRSILRCSSGMPEIWREDGTRLLFGKILNRTGGKIYLLTKRSDQFGNYITYKYANANDTGTWPVGRVKLTEIYRNDGVKVNLHYETINTREQIVSMTYGDQKVEYEYDTVFLGKIKLHKFIDQEGRATNYEYYDYAGGKWIKSIETPEKLKVVYNYGPNCDNGFNCNTLKNRTISGPNVETRSISSLFPAVWGNKRAAFTERNMDESGRTLTTEYIIDRTPGSKPYYISGQAVLAGTIKKKTLYRGRWKNGANSQYQHFPKMYEEINDWEVVSYGEAHCKRKIVSSKDYLHTCKTARKKKVTINVRNGLEYDQYVREYPQYSAYNMPTKTIEYNDFNDKKLYTKSTFQHEPSQWIINLQRKVEVSKTDSNYKVLSENTYHPLTMGGGYKLQPHVIKNMGVKTSVYSEYHSNGLNKAWQDAHGETYRFDNYKMGVARSFKAPGLTNAKKIQINSIGQITSTTDHLGNKKTFESDGLGRVLKQTYPKENGAAYWQDAIYRYSKVKDDDLGQGEGVVSGQRKRVATQGAHEKTEYFDALGRVTLIKENDLTGKFPPRYSRIKYDRYDRVVFKSHRSFDPDESKGVKTTYDVLSRKTKVVTALGTTVFDYLKGNRVRITDPEGNESTTTYLAIGDYETNQVSKIVSPEGVTTQLNHDEFGRVKSITQSGYYNGSLISKTRNFYFDNRGQLCREYHPETGYTAFKYDNNGLLKWKVEGTTTNYCNYNGSKPSNAIEYIYNERGEMEFIDYPNGTHDLYFDHDSNGNLISASRGGVHWTYSYNSLNQLKSEKLTVDGKSFTTTYHRNGRGQLTAMTYPSGRQIDFAPNTFGEPTKVGKYAKNVDYFASGKIKSFQYGNGRSYATTENYYSLPHQIIVPGVAHLTYSYDRNANVRKIVDGIRAHESKEMTYDDLNRLRTVSGPWGSASFSYDPLGNIMSKTVGNKSYSFHYDRNKNRLASVTGSRSYSFEYDVQGNVISNGHHSFTFDNANLLTKVNNGSVANNNYDANKKRVTVYEGGKKTYQVYSLDSQFIHKRNAQGLPIDYLYLKDMNFGKVAGAPGPQAPITPAYVNVPSANTSGSFVVSWVGSEGVTSYVLQEKKNTSNWATVYSGSGKSKSLSNRAMAEYQYRVKACSTNGCSEYKESAKFKVGVDDVPPPVDDEPPPPPVAVPATPTNVVAPSVDYDGKYSVSWGAVSGATHYKVMRKREGFSWAQKYNGSSNVISVNTPGLGTWLHKVQACNSAGCSLFSWQVETIVTRSSGGGGGNQCNPVCYDEP